jgi:NADPH:quinone reductase-like Zn-dependent oxidoreductase/quercetin dioxygenase-like cupin family protein
MNQPTAPQAPAGALPPTAGGARTRSVAARIHAYGGAEVLQIDEVRVPTPGPGQLLVAVGAAGVNGLDWKMREGYVRDAYPLTFPSALGLELAGEVAAVGAGVTRFGVGDRVMGLTRGPGAYADFVVVDEVQVVRTPSALSDVEAAALPVAVLTAAQALDAGGEIGAGSTVLIHGAAGAVGGFAVQLAKAAGATVLATAAGTSRDHVLGLGADVAIDYRAERFEDRAADVDLVLDLVGGETLDRSWSVLAPHGVVVSTAAPDVAARTPDGRRGVWLMMRADAERLARLADDVARGTLRSTIAEVTPLSGLAAAVERNRTGHPPGKIVLDLRAAPDHPPPAYPPVPPDDPRRQLAVARPDTDEALPHLGIGSGTYTILLGGRETAGRYAVIDMHVPPGGGPPPHRHDFEEMFTVLDGEIEVTFRGETMRVRRGETVNVPANAPHAFRVASDAPARLLCVCTPAGQEEFFREVGVPLPTRTSAPPRPDPDARARTIVRTLALAPKYRSEILLP